jgi:hypothetical protein
MIAILGYGTTLAALLPFLASLVHLSIFGSEERSRLDLRVGGGFAHLRFLQHRLNLLISLCPLTNPQFSQMSTQISLISDRIKFPQYIYIFNWLSDSMVTWANSRAC